MTIQRHLHTQPSNAAQYVLVLTQGGEPDLVGIWGPYADELAAQYALDELKQWPIDGEWEVVRLKPFPAKVPPTVTIRGWPGTSTTTI